MKFSWQGYCGSSRADVDSLRYDAKCPAKGMVYGIKGVRLYSEPRCAERGFFLQSKCGACGLWVLVRSLEELIEHEKLHRTQCSPSNAADDESRCVESQNVKT